ncbi:N-acetyltransferase [Phototrophicus methaneseepsis]|uniref:N-acetyltransferase n=2 Tax=Phototrophicus methaneseepsis TaxID=2710758 RepID=A0A7S8IH77_9CHLR|nr:N-acetyltransferase [Phototrophicus methaneseepsis]
MDSEQIEVKNNPEKNRFEVILGDQIAMVQYMIAGKNIVFTHTEVPPEFEGKGIAGKMARVALDFAKDEGYRVQALCPFIAAYVRRHPEYQTITWGY